MGGLCQEIWCFFRHPAAEFGGWSPDLRRFLFRLRGRGATRRLSVGCHHGVAWAMTVWGLTPTRIEHGRKTKTRLLNLFEGQLLQPSWAWQLGGCQPASWIRIILFFYGHIVFFMCLQGDRCCYSHDLETLGDTYIIFYLFIRPIGPQILIWLVAPNCWWIMLFVVPRPFSNTFRATLWQPSGSFSCLRFQMHKDLQTGFPS